ncbi:MAG: glycosyltransferase [Actinobacteria bacterium]|nr:glycosyltransferase [Actinomycetota bacterium]
MDSLPALILKLRYPKITWVAAWYQTAPNPWTGFSEGDREKKYRISSFFYWLVQFFIKPFIAKYADLVLVNNEEEKKIFPKLVSENRVQVMLGAVDLELINQWQDKTKKLPKIYDAVFQGRFHPQKGVLELVDIWKLVVDKKPKAKLAMIGDGPLMSDVLSKIKKLGLEENIKLFGYVYDGPEKYAIFTQSKLVVHPAFFDSGGMAAAEAMAFGLPAVGFDLKSYESYYPEGMVEVKIGDLRGFANAVIRFLSDSVYVNKVGKEALAMIRRSWSWDVRTTDLLSRIEGLKVSTHSIRKPFILLLVALIILISLTTFHEGLGFDLRGEDWYALWFAIQPDLKDVVFQTILFRDHPVLTYQEVLLAPFFKFNPFYWYFFGYICKVIGAFAVGLLVWGITKSKKAAVYSSLIFASSTIGLEAYLMVTVQAPAILLIPICLGLYFWVISERDNSIKKYLISVVFYALAFLGDPGRGISMIALGVFWDFLKIINDSSKANYVRVVARNLALIIILALLYWSVGIGVKQFQNGHPSTLVGGLSYIASQPLLALNNFVTAIGNLLIGWFIPIYESDNTTSMSYPHQIPLVSGYLFLILAVLLIGKFLLNKDNKFYRISFFFVAWIIVSFFPTWILLQWYIGGSLPGTTGRYLTISSVGFVALLGYGLSKVKARYAIILLIIILLFNISTANRILNQDWYHRSALVHNVFWDKVERTVPRGQKDTIILFTGGTHLGSELASTYSIPLGLKRGINITEDLPITTGDRELVKKLLCEDNVYRPDFRVYGPARFGAILQREKIPLSHLYAWRIYEDSFVDVTEQERKLLRTEVNCKLD